MMKKTTVPVKRTGTRDAVETAIDLAKSDKYKTWDFLALQQSERISKWAKSKPIQNDSRDERQDET